TVDSASRRSLCGFCRVSGVRDENLVALLGAYDAQLRAHVHDPLPHRVHVERDGPLLRTVGFGGRGFVEYRDLDGLDGSELDDLGEERAADPDGLRIFVAEAGDVVVCAGWVRFPSGTEFATLWGGATLPAWRGRGIYRALVAHRARLAADRGCRYLEVDASDDSRPILERLGFAAVTTTTPYVWSPPAVA